MIEARSRAGLTQEELAERMGTTQPVVARLESGRIRPSTRTLERLAQATGSRLIIPLRACMRGPEYDAGQHVTDQLDAQKRRQVSTRSFGYTN